MSKNQQTVEEQIAFYRDRIITRDIAWKILSNSDARDAMKFIQAVGRDVRFANIVATMQDEDIWKFWTRRDMGEVFEDLPFWAEKDAIDGPKWKLVYLWYRLTYRVYQQHVLRRYLEDAKTHEHGAYPPGTLRMARLNVITANFPNNGGVFELDFRREYPRLCADMGIPRPLSIFDQFKMDAETILREIQTIYGFSEEMEGLYINYAKIIREFAIDFSRIIYRNDPKNMRKSWDIDEFGDRLTNIHFTIIRSFPREYVPGRIMVGCAACSTPTNIQCSCPCATPYCGKECQKEHHSLM